MVQSASYDVQQSAETEHPPAAQGVSGPPSALPQQESHSAIAGLAKLKLAAERILQQAEPETEVPRSSQQDQVT